MARYFYFTQILYHKTRSIIEKSAEEIYNTALNEELTINDKPIFNYMQLYDIYSSKELSDFDDSYFDKVVDAVLQNSSNKRSKNFAKVIKERNIPECINEKFTSSAKPNDILLKIKDQNTTKLFFENDDNDVITDESFEMLDNYYQIKERTNWLASDTDRLYEDREAVRLLIPENYNYESNKVFLCDFKDSILNNLANNKFNIFRKYRFR